MREERLLDGLGEKEGWKREWLESEKTSQLG